uniref:Uncharacterized protein n=1 Tax=Piliocolobus tephrosceles TaxID=591936 RepID=A0A8C9IWV4_9PRIM
MVHCSLDLQAQVILPPQPPKYLDYRYGLQAPGTSARKFLTRCDAASFLINTASLFSLFLPKLPQFHGVPICSINKS